MGVARALSALLLIWMIFVIVACAAVALALVVMGGVPDGFIRMAHVASSAAEATAIVSTTAAGLVMWLVLAETLLTVVAVARMLRSAMQGEPFVDASIARLRIVAGAYALSFLTKNLLPSIAPIAVGSFLAARGWAYDLGDLGPVMIALFLAEVFRAGIRLRDDVAMTV